MMSSKYHSVKCTVDGIKFDSRREARRYKELSLMERAGAISELRRQVKFVLVPAQYETIERYGENGKRLKDTHKLAEREISYVADFVYIEGNSTVIEDSKGVKTKEYILKRKLMLYILGIKVKEV